MNKSLQLLCLLLFWGVGAATVNSQVKIDTLERKTIGPGVEYIRMQAPSVPWSIHMLKVNLKNPYISLETCLANERLAAGKERTSAMSARRNLASHWSVGAVNADFFNPDGSPVNLQVEAGESVRMPNGYPAVAWTAADKMYMGNLTYAGKVITKSATLTLTGINAARSAATSVIMYNRFFGGSTSTDTAGTELLLRPLSGWLLNDTIRCVVDSVARKLGNMAIPAGYAVISAGTTAAASLATVNRGDTVKLSLFGFQGIKKVNELIGGHPVIVKNCAVAPMDSTDTFNTARHPRTAIGFNADTTVAYLVEIDGRQSALSLGVNLYEFAALMINWGAYQAINLDGGGSSTMVVRNEVMNSPSDGSERAVANSIIVVSSAPSGTLSIAEIFPKSARIFTGSQKTFTLNTLDQYFNPVPYNPATLKFTVSKPSLGSISTTGVFTAGTVRDSGYVIAEANGIKDSALVIVKALNSVAINPKTAVTDNKLLLTFSMKAYDSDGNEISSQPSSIQWKCLDTTIGKVDPVGQFQGRRAGLARVVVNYAGLADTALVMVEIGQGNQILDSLETTAFWSVTGQNIDSAGTSLQLTNQYVTLGAAALQVNYKFTYASGVYNWLFVKNDVRVYGVPDSIEADIRSEGPSHRVFFDLTDAINQNVRVMGHKMANRANAYETIRALLPKTGNITYPLTLRSVTMVLGSTQTAGQVYQGTVCIDNIRAVYPAATKIKGLKAELDVPARFQLHQNYPNPCNPETQIAFDLPEAARVKLTLYSVLGKEVWHKEEMLDTAGRHSFSVATSQLASGTYLYRIQATGASRVFRASRKMVVLK